MVAVATRDLSRHYGKIQAVNQLNLKIPTGSLFGLIGPNGAGKTTTLRMLAGLLEPSSGDIRLNELSQKQYWREIQWQIGYMPDFFGVYDNLLVWEYLDFYARCYRLTPERRARAISDLLDLVDLGEKRDVYVHTLSRGMRQRLCLAHALVHDPQILLLDEPASGLDPRARVEMRMLLRELQSMGKTILLSSHILVELAELCDQVAIMERGQLVVSGAIDEVLRKAAGRRTIAIQVLNDPGCNSTPDRAIALLEQIPSVQNIFPQDRVVAATPGSSGGLGITSIEIEFYGDEFARADLLEKLVSDKIRVAAFNETITNLEEAFLRLTQGEVG